jgi:hypothetical protein
MSAALVIVIIVAVLGAAILVTLLIVIVGIHRDEHRMSLDEQPPGCSAVIARRITGAYASPYPEIRRVPRSHEGSA